VKYLNKSFSVGTENSAAYRDNYDRIFGKKAKPEKQPDFERCRECGSWEAQCSAPGPVPGCACTLRCEDLHACDNRQWIAEAARLAARVKALEGALREISELYANPASSVARAALAAEGKP
jgi:hypothetical protein